MAEFENEDQIREAIAKVRKDNDPTDWMAISYAGPKSTKWTLIGQGSGGVDEIRALIKEDNVLFALFRLEDKIDDSVTVKFVMLNWLGEKLPRMAKARLSVHRGAIESLLNPYHTDHTTSDEEEVDFEFFMKKVMGVSGSGSKVLDSAGRAHLESTSVNRSSGSQTRTPAVAKQAPGEALVFFDDEDGIRAAIQNVRSDAHSEDWVAVEHLTNNHVALVSSGTGPIADGFMDLLKDDRVVYGLVRKTEKFDESVTVKFCYVYWVGENVPRMHRARLATAKGDVDKMFHPWHIDIYPTTLAEINDDIIETKIGKNTGTKTNVLDDTVEAGYYHN